MNNIQFKNLKFIVLIVLAITFIISGCDNEKPYSPTREPREQVQARYNKMLACQPKMPLSRSELYEKAMLEYWKRRTRSAFSADAAAYSTELEKPKLYRNKLNGDEYKIKCGLTYYPDGTPDKVTNDICYPYQVYQFDELKDFYFFDDKEYKNKNLNDFIINNQAKVYRWDKQLPIYKAKNYNKDVDFMVRHDVYTLDIYPKDCCKLLTYNEVLEQEKNGISFYDNWRTDVAPIESLSQYSFLIIKTLYDIIGRTTTEPPYKENYDIFAITHCGEIL